MNFKNIAITSLFVLASSTASAEFLEKLQKGKQILEISQQILQSPQQYQQQQQQNIQYQPQQQIQVTPESIQASEKMGVSRTSGQCSAHYPMGVPTLLVSDADKVARRAFYTCQTNYATMQDPQTKNPVWVSEVLIGSQQKETFVKRVDNFAPHPNMPKQVQSSLSDYRGSGFDRGHMAPAADMLTPFAMEESFYLTNMVPQVGPNMNRTIWADLEGVVRKWSENRGLIQVFTGPIYNGQLYTMGRSEVWVPDALYKVVLDLKTYETISFIIPNRQIVTRKTKSLDKGNPSFPHTQEQYAVNCNKQCTLDNFIVPLSSVEKQAGLKFFPRVPEQQLVNYNNPSRMWHAR